VGAKVAASTGTVVLPPRRRRAAIDGGRPASPGGGSRHPDGGFGFRETPWITVPSVFTVTGTVQKDAWDRNVIPPVEKVRPGLWSVPVPIPNNPLRYVSVYVLELDNGVALVDAGWPTDDAWDALNAGLTETGGSMSDVRAVVVTHLHPDHYGLAGRVREASGAWVGLHPADAKLLDARYHDTDDLVDRMRELLALSGVPEDKLPDLAFASMEVKSTLDVALPDILIEDDELIALPGWDFRAVWTPGHSPGHICLYSDDNKLLLSGDHVLPRITPNISFHSQQFANPLGDYLESLAKVRALHPDEVLPAHEYRFSGLEDRVDALTKHHVDRLLEIEGILAKNPGISCWDLTLALSWSRPWDDIHDYMQRAANGETLAHLVLLERRGRVVREATVPARFYLAE
jgi:glyoxylase-like metal-dependent hydrolase (beta-lactamase superfamily II)